MLIFLEGMATIGSLEITLRAYYTAIVNLSNNAST